MEWMYIYVSTKISPGSGIWGRSKIHNRFESWAWELYHLMGGFALLRATFWKSTWGWMAGQLSDGVNLPRLHEGGEILRSWKTQRYIVITNSGSPFRCLSSVQFSHSVVSDSLPPHELQHTRPPCPSPTPGDYSDSCPSSRWCHPAISSSVVSFSSCPQSLPASESFPVSQLFTWGGHSIGVSALASVLPMNTQDWPPLEWTGWISLQSKGLSRVFSNTTVQKHQFFGAQLSSYKSFLQ